MAINYAALRTEIQTDPRAYGYASAQGNFQNLADMLNLARAGITVRRSDILPSEVLEAIDSRDFNSTPNAAHVAWFESVTQLDSMRLVDDAGADTRILANIKRLIVNTQGSTTRLNAIANKVGSRAEELFGSGTFISAEAVATALAG